MYEESVMRETVNQFPNISGLIGIERLLSVASNDSNSPIIYYLYKSLPDETGIQELVEVLKEETRHIGALAILD